MTKWLICVGIAVAAATAGTAAARGGQLCVGGPHCFASIQAAVDAAQDGDTIRIAPGTYGGGIVVAKSVDLLGSGANATTISGGGHVVTIGSASSSPTVTLTGLTITGGHATDNPQSPNCAADVPSCGPGYADSTALGVESRPSRGRR
jgi:nitrous oxidase accessory protein NosD